MLVIYLATVLTLALFTHAAVDSNPQAVEQWFRNFSGTKEKITRLHFYIQDVFSRRTPTAVKVARTKMTETLPTFFGLVRVFDDPLTVTRTPSSRTIGYGQGIYAGASQSDIAFLFTLNFYFTEGKYDGIVEFTVYVQHYKIPGACGDSVSDI